MNHTYCWLILDCYSLLYKNMYFLGLALTPEQLKVEH